MISIDNIREKLKKDKALERSLSALVDYCIGNKTLVILKNYSGANLSKLQAEGIIKQVSENYILEDYLFFGYKFYKRYSSSLKLKSYKNFSKIAEGLTSIKRDFSSQKNGVHYYKLEKVLWAIAIIEHNRKYRSNLNDYIDKLDKGKELYLFNEGYSLALPVLKIEVEVCYNNAVRLINILKSDAYYNMPLSTLLNGIYEKVIIDTEYGLNCFNYSIERKKIETTFIIPIIQGLYDMLGYRFYVEYLKPLMENKKYVVAIVVGLSNIKKVTNKEARLFFSLVDKLDKENQELLINLPKLLFAIQKSGYITDKGIVKRSFSYIGTLIILDNETLISFILHELQFINNHIEHIVSLLITFLQKGHFDIEKHLESLVLILNNKINLNQLFLIIRELASAKPYELVSEHLKLLFDALYQKDDVEFEKSMISLLIHNSGAHRFIGRQILLSLTNPLRDSFVFKYNILNLESIKQYKLWVSICQDYKEPKYVIPCLLPLIKSNSELVRESFISKLEEYSENYGKSLIEILEKYLDLNDSYSNLVFNRIKRHSETFFSEKINIKNEIKEFNPLYTQNKHFIKYNTIHSRKLKNEYNKVTKESSALLNIIPTVYLAKGGGWKIEGSDRISELSNFKWAFPLPRSLFIEPEIFEYEHRIETLRDWGNYFDEIEKGLEDE